jgi:hypothetical protein
MAKKGNDRKGIEAEAIEKVQPFNFNHYREKKN